MQDFESARGIQGVYKISNVKNGKVYIGSSKNIRNRWMSHLRELNNGTHHSKKLQNSWNRYKDKELFKFEIIEVVTDNSTLLDVEQKYIDSYDSFENGYNSTRHSDPSKVMSGVIENNKKKKYNQSKIADEIEVYCKDIILFNELISKTQSKPPFSKLQLDSICKPNKNTVLKHKRLSMLFKWYVSSKYLKDENCFTSVHLKNNHIDPAIKVYINKDGELSEMFFVSVNKKTNIIEKEVNEI